MCCLLCLPCGDHTGSSYGPGGLPMSWSDNSNSGCFCLCGGFFFAGGSTSLEVSEEDDDDAAFEGFFLSFFFFVLLERLGLCSDAGEVSLLLHCVCTKLCFEEPL